MDMDMSMDEGGTVVQTRLPPEEYERFRRAAEAEGATLKEALREAARRYAGSHGRPDPDDPLFAFEPADESGERFSAADTDDVLYGER